MREAEMRRTHRLAEREAIEHGRKALRGRPRVVGDAPAPVSD